MFNTKGLLRFLDTGFVLKIFLLTLLISLLPLIEIYLFIYLAALIGNYFLLAIAAATGFAALFLAFIKIRKIIAAVKARIREGYYPEEEFTNLAGIFTGSILLLIPGFVSDFFGILFFFTFLKKIAGRIIVKIMENRLKELYEYLKLYEF